VSLFDSQYSHSIWSEHITILSQISERRLVIRFSFTAMATKKHRHFEVVTEAENFQLFTTLTVHPHQQRLIDSFEAL
jgi:hypothetical protein